MKKIAILSLLVALVILGVSIYRSSDACACREQTPSPTPTEFPSVRPTPTEEPTATPSATPTATPTVRPERTPAPKDDPDKSDPCYWHKDEYGWDCDTKEDIFVGEDPVNFGPSK